MESVDPQLTSSVAATLAVGLSMLLLGMRKRRLEWRRRPPRATRPFARWRSR